MQTPTWFFVINPVSGRGKGLSVWQALEPRLIEARVSYQWAISAYHRHAIELTALAYKRGIRHFVGLGGDGTLNELLNGIFDAAGSGSAQGCMLGLLPIGTGNDWVRSQHEKLHLNTLLQKLVKPPSIPYDVGIVELGSKEGKSYFLNVAGAGLDGQVVRALEEKTKNGRIGKFSYYSGLVKSLFAYQAPECIVTANQKALYAGRPIIVAAAKGRYFGGGMQISPRATYDSAALDITIVEKVPAYRVLLQLPKLFTGRIYSASFVQKARVTGIHLRAESAMAVQADGEFVGTSREINVQVLPGAIRVLT
jgi:YegS/Rv2252/BmrU family lipid kinase